LIDVLLRGLIRASIRRPRLTMAILTGIVLAAVPGLARLELRTDGHALVPPDDPAVLLDASIRREFDLRDQVVVLIRTDHPEGIYNAETLQSVRLLSEALISLEAVGPEHVMSLATERGDRVYPGTLRFRPFLDPLPTTPAEMERLRGDLAAVGILTGTLVAADGTATTVLVGVPPDASARDRAALHRSILAAVEPFRSSGDEIVVVGAPVAEALLGLHLLGDLALLLPLAVAVIAILVWVGCRRAAGVVLALTEVGSPGRSD